MKASAAVLGFEPAWPGGAVKTERKGSGSFVLRARGRAAHAGADFEKGANAIVELSRVVLEGPRSDGPGAQRDGERRRRAGRHPAQRGPRQRRGRDRLPRADRRGRPARRGRHPWDRAGRYAGHPSRGGWAPLSTAGAHAPRGGGLRGGAKRRLDPGLPSGRGLHGRRQRSLLRRGPGRSRRWTGSARTATAPTPSTSTSSSRRSPSARRWPRGSSPAWPKDRNP